MRRVLVVLAAGLLVAPALAGITSSATGPAMNVASTPERSLLWDNVPSGLLDGSKNSSQMELVYPFRSGVADDFLCGFEDPTWECYITEVHWWGGYWNPYGSAPNTTEFGINFYADAGGMPTGGDPDPEPTALVHYTIPYENVNAVLIDPTYSTYYYSVELPTPAVLQCTELYWMEIYSVNTFPPQWGWSGSADFQLYNAVQGFPLLGTPFWSMLSRDMAFQLYGYCIPEPASLMLLGAALLLVRRR